jgi:uncharacterized membrane protein required for colicin V production
MGWVDIGIVAVLIGCAVFGFRRGFVNQAVELAGLLGGVVLALYLTGGLVENYAQPLSTHAVTYPLVFLAIVGVALLVAQVVGRVASEVMQVTFFGMFDQIGGAAAGLVKGMLWMSIAITIATHLGFGGRVDDQMQRSNFAGPLSQLLPAAYDMVKTHARNAPLREPFRTDAQQPQTSSR